MLRIFSRVFLAAVVLTAAFLGTLYSIAAPAPPARTSDEAGVRVIVTPKALGHDVKVLEFAVVMDTHVKPLNDDLMQTAVLIDSAGGRTSPTTCSISGTMPKVNPPLGGYCSG